MAEQEQSHVDIHLSPGADTDVYLDREAGLPKLVIVAGPVEIVFAPGGAELGEADAAAADAIAALAAEYAHRIRALVDACDDGPVAPQAVDDDLVRQAAVTAEPLRLRDVPPTDVTAQDLIARAEQQRG